MDIQALGESIAKESAFTDILKNEIGKAIIGQNEMVEGLLLALLTGGHILLEGVPGLAKTAAVKTLSSAVDLTFSRLQFTPDLLPADLTGAQVYNANEASFFTRKGPIFANVILADEINRAPAKVQSALLEAMQERQVTIGEESFKLPSPFITLATQNPIEQEGTYALPEAQVDRFMLKLKIDYPTKDEELKIVKLATMQSEPVINKVIGAEDIEKAKSAVESIYMDDRLTGYIVTLVRATREPSKYDLDIGRLLALGASPRASIFLSKSAKAYAFLEHRAYVIPDDIKKAALPVMRHRIIRSYEADAEEVDSDDILKRILEKVEVP